MTAELAMLLAPAPHTLDTIPPLILRLTRDFHAVWLTEIDDRLKDSGDTVLLIAGDAIRFPECLDVAAVLPEIQSHFARLGKPLALAVVLPEHEDAIARQFGVQHRPALVFLRNGNYVGTIRGMLDWDDFLKEFSSLFDLPVSRPPSIGIPVRSADAGQNHCH